ncbi:zinc finger MYM-type protein 1-like protein [Tanacetum coccineum]
MKEQAICMLVVVGKNHDGVMKFFEKLMCVVNVVSSSCKRKDMVRDNYKQRIELELNEGVTESGKGKNQELSLIRPSDTRWGSHYKTIVRLFSLFCEVIKVLKYVEKEALDGRNRNQATVLKMDEIYVAKRNRVASIKNRQYFGIDIFDTDLDMQIQEFGDRFDDFTDANSFSLRRELDLYYETVIHDTYFMKLTGIAELATLMVTRKKHISFPLIYKLMMLSLLLHVATATVERYFSAMKLIKTNLHNKMGENYRNDALIWKIEKELFAKVTNQDVMKRFQGSKRRRCQ